MDAQLKKQFVNDLKQVNEDIQALARNASEDTKHKLTELSSRAQDLYEQAVAQSKEVGRKVDVKVREKPWHAVAVAGAVGLALGALINRK